MGKVTLVLDDKLEEKFRDTIYKSKGMRRGNIQSSIEEAIQMWIDEKLGEEKSGRSNTK